MIDTLVLSPSLQAQLGQEARAAFPRECCGLIEGKRDSLMPNWSKQEVIALHPMSNLATEPDRFEIDPATHIALLRSLRGTGRTIIGCYHTHPNGRPEPSPRDLEGAAETRFLWLIGALESAGAEPRLACFVWTGSAFAPIQISLSSGTG